MNHSYQFPINYQQLVSVIDQLNLEDKMNLLRELQERIAFEEPTIQLSETEKKNVDKGLRSIKSGKLISNEEVNALTRSKYPHLFE